MTRVSGITGGVTLQQAYGEMSMTTPASTTITTGGTFQKLNGTTAAGDVLNFTHVASNRLRYDGADTQFFLVNVSCSIVPNDRDVYFALRLAKNGTTIADTEVQQESFDKIENDEQIMSLNAIVELATDDYLELFGTWETGTDGSTLQLQKLNMTVNTMGGAQGPTGPTGAKGDTISSIVLTAAGGWPSTTNGCDVPLKKEYATNDVDMFNMAFDQTSDEFAQWTLAMPSEWDGGTVTAILYWTAIAGAGNVIWGVQGRSFGDSDAIDQAFGTAQTVTDTLITADDVHITSATAAITLAGTPAGGELVQFRVYRDADAGGDTLTADANLLAVKLVYNVS
jgi:hypothetical protein